MTTGPAGEERPQIRCPYCLDQFSWDGQALYELDDDGNYMALPDVGSITDPLKRGEQEHKAFVRCPNPSGDLAKQHYLPIDYVRYREPLVIGFIGGPTTGKSTLLAMMVDEIDNQKLLPHGFAAQPLMQTLHELYRDTTLRPLIEDAKPLEATRPDQESIVEFTDAFLLVKGDDLRQPIVFFDVGGESLTRVGTAGGARSSRATRFLRAVSAFIFVVDPDHLLGRDNEAKSDARGRPVADDTFRRVLGNLAEPSGGPAQYLEKPAAIVLAKADVLRFMPTVARWLAREDGVGRLDPRFIHEESRDVYAFLYQHRGESWLLPFDRFRRCTLHVVSATGSKVLDQSYRSLRPRRVLDPLVAILAMTGVIEGQDAAKVGR